MSNDNRQLFVDKDKQSRPLMVIVPSPDRLDAALKIFKRMVKESRIMVEYQNHEAFKKPSAKRREKFLRARARRRYGQEY
jgi:ribosomal protein S21